jgi:hypothetical protein
MLIEFLFYSEFLNQVPVFHVSACKPCFMQTLIARFARLGAYAFRSGQTSDTHRCLPRVRITVRQDDTSQ